MVLSTSNNKRGDEKKKTFDPHKKIVIKKKKDTQPKISFTRASELKNFQGFPIKKCTYVPSADKLVYIPPGLVYYNGAKNAKDMVRQFEYCQQCHMCPCIMDCIIDDDGRTMKEGMQIIADEYMKGGVDGNWVVRPWLEMKFRHAIMPHFFPESYLLSDQYVLYFGCMHDKIKEWYPGEADNYLVKREERRLRGEYLTPIPAELGYYTDDGSISSSSSSANSQETLYGPDDRIPVDEVYTNEKGGFQFQEWTEEDEKEYQEGMSKWQKETS